MNKNFFEGKKKLIVAVVCILLPALNVWLGLGLAVEDVLASEVGGASYVIGQGLADFAKHAKTARK